MTKYEIIKDLGFATGDPIKEACMLKDIMSIPTKKMKTQQDIKQWTQHISSKYDEAENEVIQSIYYNLCILSGVGYDAE